MKKTFPIGRIPLYNQQGILVNARVWCDASLEDGELSISWVEGPRTDGDCLGSCGQSRTPADAFVSFEEGWTKEKYQKLLDIHEDWHLNHMNAGTPAQTTFLKGLKAGGWKYDYKEACQKLKEAGLNPDPGHLIMYPGWLGKYEKDLEKLEAAGIKPERQVWLKIQIEKFKKPQPYLYGHAWLKRELPGEVVEWFNNLPHNANFPWR